MYLLNKGVVHPWFCDVMGHMNVRHYVGMFDDACFQLLAEATGWCPGAEGWQGKGQGIEGGQMTKPGEWKGGKLTLASRKKLALIESDRETMAVWWSDVLDRIASGTNLVQLAQQEGVTIGVLSRWIKENKARNDDYEMAARTYAEIMVAETINIADGT